MALRLCMVRSPFQVCFANSQLQNNLCSKYFSTKVTKIELNECVVITDDGSTIVCWHPQQKFPYECSLPLPDKPVETNTVFNVQSQKDVKAVFKPKTEQFVREELMRITHTTKHRWFPRARDKFAKKTPPDRKYL